MKLADKIMAVTLIAVAVYFILNIFFNQVLSAGIASAAAVLVTMLYSDITKIRKKR